LIRAKGKCEFCGEPGFMTTSGRRYLETHHVIFLANEGADKLTNVIALCPNDHREAHLGKRRAAIETEMILKLRAINR
jgi:predicted HNH restriction endonuclease